MIDGPSFDHDLDTIRDAAEYLTETDGPAGSVADVSDRIHQAMLKTHYAKTDRDRYDALADIAAEITACMRELRHRSGGSW
jgi:hypothetical protein